MKKNWLMAAFMFINTLLFSQGINFQAIARNTDGEVLSNNTLKVAVSIWNTDFSNTSIFSELHQVRTNAYGQFTLVVGQGTNQSIPFEDIQWSSSNHYLGLRIDAGRGWVDLGRTALQSVPYSKFANVAQKVTEASLSELTDVDVQNPGNGQVLQWNGATWAPATPLYTPWLSNGNLIYYNAGRVGIGTQNPAGLLHLQSESTSFTPQLWLKEISPGGISRLYLGNENTSQRWWSIQARSLVDAPEFQILYKQNNSESVRFSINPNALILGNAADNVGIGLDNPSEKLHINGAIRLGNTNKNQSGTIRWTGTDFEGFKSNQWVSLTANSSPERIWEVENGQTYLAVGSQIGVGLKNPKNLLHLNNSNPVTGSPAYLQITNANTGLTENDGLQIGVFTTADGVYGHLMVKEKGGLRLGTNNAYHLNLLEDGALGLGTINPKGKMEIAFNSGDHTTPQLMITENEAGFGRISFNSQGVNNKFWTIAAKTNASDAASQFNFFYANGSNGQNVLSLNGNGQVGIGTAVPERILHLNANTTSTTSGQLLISQASLGDAFLNIGIKNSSHYALGIDNSDSDKFKIGYDANEAKGVTDNTLLELDPAGNLEVKGEINRPTTGASNLLPICFGHVASNGTIKTGTGNFSVEKTDTGNYQITIQNTNFFFEDFIVAITSVSEGTIAVATSVNGKLLIKIKTPLGISTNANFNFIVYHP